MDEYVYLGGVLLVAVYLFWSQRLRPDVTAMLVMLSLIVPWPHADGEWHAVLTHEQGFSGFGSSALIMIAAMFVIGGALVQTGAAEVIGLRVLRRAAGSRFTLQLAVLFLSTAVSMFINDTTVVLIMLPLVLSVCREFNLPPSQYLLFAAYGSLLGGQWTLIGTRSNIIVSDVLRQATGEGIPFFSFALLGAPIFLASALFMLTVAGRLLPSNKPALSAAEMKHYLTQVRVPASSSMIGKRFSTANVTAVALIRDGERLPPRLPLESGDRLLVKGTLETIYALLKSPDYLLDEPNLDLEAIPNADLVSVEALVPANSYYIGQQIAQIPFERNYGVWVLGMAHQGRPVSGAISESVLSAGDSLLLFGPAENVERLKALSGLTLLDRRTVPHFGKFKSWIVLGLLASIAATSVLGILPPTISIPLAAAAAVLTGCISIRAAYEAIDLPTLITLGGIIPFGLALEESGAAAALAELTVASFSESGGIVVLCVLLLTAVLLTQVIENAAAAVIVAPIAINITTAMDMNPAPVMTALAVCVSAGFATPIAHESTILVMNAGRYRFRDYLGVGSVMAAITWLTACVFTPMLWAL